MRLGQISESRAGVCASHQPPFPPSPAPSPPPRHLVREDIAASAQYVVGCACLAALTNLAINIVADERQQLRGRVRDLLVNYSHEVCVGSSS